MKRCRESISVAGTDCRKASVQFAAESSKAESEKDRCQGSTLAAFVGQHDRIYAQDWNQLGPENSAGLSLARLASRLATRFGF